MNYNKLFLSATLAMTFNQSFGMFFPAHTWLCDVKDQQETPTNYVLRQIEVSKYKQNTVSEGETRSMLNHTSIRSSEREASKQLKKEDRQRKRDLKQKTQEQIAVAPKKQRAALDERIEAEENKADRFLLTQSKEKNRKK